MPRTERTFFGHPWGLSTLFMTETWERFSYYGMKAILLYYMYYQVDSGGLGMDPALAKSIFSVYGAALYMSGIIGGWVSDRLVGARRSITYGCIFIMGAHIALSIPSGGKASLFASMILLVLGTGLLKPSIIKGVGDLYDEKDSRRDSGFTVFVMGVQIGAFLAPLLLGWLTSPAQGDHSPGHNQFHLGFGLAAIGMAIGLTQYLLRQRTLAHVRVEPTNPLEPAARTRVLCAIGGGVLVLAAAVTGLALTGNLSADLVVNTITVTACGLPVVYIVVMLRSPKVTGPERSKVRAFIPLFIAMVIFWFVEEQQATVFAQYADQQMDQEAWGFHFDPAWSQIINPITMLVFAPVVAMLWLKLGKRQPNTPQKFALGLILTGIGFALPIIPFLTDGAHAKVNPVWLVLSIGVISVGELLTNPVSLSATTQLAPVAFASQTVGLNYASDAAAQGLIAQVSKLYTLETSGFYFAITGAIVVVLGMLFFLIAPLIKRRMGD